jgi:hypothetical protein
MATFKDIVLVELPKLYPALIHKVIVLNTPIFFEYLYEAEIKQ